MNDIVQWDPNSGAALPAYLADAMGGLGSNMPDRQTVPSLSYEGKTWTIVMDGNKTKMQYTNQDGDLVPTSVMRLVILNFNGDRGRAYYPGIYNPSESKQPDCWSPDGKAPSDNSVAKQNPVCNGCPMSIKGSKVQDGKEMVACSSHRMIAIAPANDLKHDPLRLKIAVTSDWDKEVVEHGWFAFRQYMDFLKARGITHSALVVTKVKFDPTTAFPKLLFALDRLLTQEEVAQAVEAIKSPKVGELLAEKWTAAGAAGNTADQSDTRPYGLEGALVDGWIAHPAAPGYHYKGEEVVDDVALAARYPAPPPPPVKEEAKAPPPPPVKEEAKAPPPPPATAPAPEPEAPHGIAAAELDGWIAHPTAPGYHYKGDVVEASDKVAAFFPKQEAAPAPEPAAPPPPPPAPEPKVMTRDEMFAAATADGWAKHPDGDWLYKGSEVLATDDVLARYDVGNGAASAATPSAPAPDAGTTAQTSASPSSPPPSGSAEIPAEVADLLGKWAGES